MVTPLPIHGVDCSHHQRMDLDFVRAKKAGVRWVYAKATEGTTFKDRTYAERRRIAREAGLVAGAYHFARPELGDATAEARAFLDFADPQPGDLLPCLDLEDRGGLSRAELTAWVGTFTRVVEDRVGVRPIIYTPFDLDDTLGLMLWVARYHPENAAPRVPKPWKRYDLRQYSNGVLGVPNSCPGLGHLDLNVMRPGLTLADLRIPATATKPKPQPKPEPKSDPMDRPLWRGRTNVDALTIQALEHAEHLGGHTFVVTQGSYQSTVKASAGTHDGGGAVDLRWCGHGRCLLALRKAGFAAWHRTPAQGSWPHHVHAVLVDHPKLSPSAARQVVAYRNGRNGLANNGEDDGPRVDPIPVWRWRDPAPQMWRGEHYEAADDALEAAEENADKTGAKKLADVTRRIRAALAKIRLIPKR